MCLAKMANMFAGHYHTTQPQPASHRGYQAEWGGVWLCSLFKVRTQSKRERGQERPNLNQTRGYVQVRLRSRSAFAMFLRNQTRIRVREHNPQ